MEVLLNTVSEFIGAKPENVAGKISIDVPIKKPRQPRQPKPPKEVLEDCPICLEKMTKRHKLHKTECNHQFHMKCFERVQTANCPCCRGQIEPGKKQKLAILKKDIDDLRTDYDAITANFVSTYQDTVEERKEFEEELDVYKMSFQTFKDSLKEFVESQRQRFLVIKEHMNNPVTYEDCNSNPKAVKWRRKCIQEQLKEEQRYLIMRETFHKKKMKEYKDKMARTTNILKEIRDELKNLSKMYREDKTYLLERIKEKQAEIKLLRKTK